MPTSRCAPRGRLDQPLFDRQRTHVGSRDVMIGRMDRLSSVMEAVSAELSITQPREIALYARVFSSLAGQAAYDTRACVLIVEELDRLRAG
ncbi:hypothetical protein [Actinoplanes rectilineatus]|uniref:hypothetical protein n=1 Tax=Actinoplanes rectilineatus TaxID=113571 RepID=UPI0012F7BE58|nr:hypothetical protein [Actinoplanes rectilineatus]